jgi:hypothetical protein
MRLTRKSKIRGLATLLVVLVMVPTAASAGQDELAQVRKATAQFHRVEVAQEAGYKLGYNEAFPLDHCIAHPTAGAMGYHYFNIDLINDISVDALEPEGAVYAPGPNGQRNLVAVEWIVPKAAWEAAGNTEPPSVLGQPMHVLNPALGWYILHAWVWSHNPSGMFEDWNPKVVCP